MKKKTIIKEVICIFIFLVTLTLTIVVLNEVLAPKWLTNKDNSHRYIMRGFYEEEKNSLDVIFMGNSDTYRGISPIKIWEDYNITSYNYVSSGQRMWTGYYMLLEALKYQHPKVIFFNVDELRSSNHSSFSNYRKVFDDMKLDDVKIKAIMDDEAFGFSKEKKISMFFKLLNYHTRYNELTKEDFTYAFKPLYNFNKGLDMITISKPYTKDYTDVPLTDEVAPLDSKVLKYLDKFVKTCKDNDIELVFFYIPSPDSWNIKNSNSIKKYAKEHDIEYLDLNLIYKDIGIDFTKDTCDAGDHLNVYGAEKVSSYIGSYINKHYTFAKKSEKLIERWNNDCLSYNKFKENLEKEEHK